jgi:hypothetical protein
MKTERFNENYTIVMYHTSAFFFGYQPFYYIKVVDAHIQLCNLNAKVAFFAGFLANRRRKVFIRKNIL